MLALMKTSTIAWIVVVLVIIVGAWYWWMQSATPAPLPVASATTSTSTAGTSNPNSIQNNLTLGTDATSSLGTYLIAQNGMTLYTYSKDSAGTSTCYTTCAANWGPYSVPAGMQLNLEASITGQVGTIIRTDGTTQLTYNGMPLYFFTGDTASGDVSGQGVAGFSVAKP